MISAQAIAQLEQPDPMAVLVAFGQLEGQTLDAASLLLLATVASRWRGNLCGNYGQSHCHLPCAVPANPEVVRGIEALLHKHLPCAELPEHPQAVVEGCALLGQGVYPAIETQAEFRYPEIRLEQLEFYERHQVLFDQAMQHSPTMQQEFVLLAQILWSHWRLPQAGVFLQKALHILPHQGLRYLLGDNPRGNSATWYCWAEHQRHSIGNLENALHGFRQFLSLEPNSALFANFATTEYDLTQRNLPISSVQAWAEVGEILLLQGKPQAAQTAFLNAIRLAADSQQAPHLALARLLTAAGENPEEAYLGLWTLCQQHGKPHLGGKQHIALELRLAASDWLRQKTLALWQHQDKTALFWCKKAIEQLRAHLKALANRTPNDAALEACVRRDKPWSRLALVELQKVLQQHLLELRLLQAQIALELHHDLWQARSLYQNISHPEAKRQLEEIQRRLALA